MSRYVKADMIGCPCGYCEGYKECQEEVDSAPSIDIVFCKECKYWRNTDAEKIPTANIMCGHMHPDDFCSYGERREP